MVSPTKYYSNPECFLPAVKIKYARPTVKNVRSVCKWGKKTEKAEALSVGPRCRPVCPGPPGVSSGHRAAQACPSRPAPAKDVR